MNDDKIQVIPNDPVDQETANVLSAMLRYLMPEIEAAVIHELMYGPEENIPAGASREILELRRRLNDHPHP